MAFFREKIEISVIFSRIFCILFKFVFLFTEIFKKKLWTIYEKKFIDRFN